MRSREVVERHVARREAALERVREMLVAQLGVTLAPADIDPDVAIFGTGLGLDSVDAVELVLCLETELGVHLGEGELARGALRTVSSIVDRVVDAEANR